MGGIDRMNRSKTVKLTTSALCLALCLLLPFVTGHIRQIGNALCPMHFPVLLCGFLCGAPWGMAVGFVAPLLRYLLFHMPPIFPTGISMAFELATYGAVAGLLYARLPKRLVNLYVSLIAAMVAGRLVWGAVRFVLALVFELEFPFSAFLSGALLTAIPGIILQIVLIPPIVLAVNRYVKSQPVS
jgi:thiamine transporter ThiT